MGFPYTDNIPQPGDFPSASQGQFLNNFEYLKAFGSRDHEFTQLSTTANDGTHKQITLNTLGASPGFAGANAVVYAQSVTPPQGAAATQIFFDAGTPVQLTSHTPVDASSGYSYLPGGFMIIWGTNNCGNNTTVSFPNDPVTASPLKLRSNCYVVTATIAQNINFGFVTVTALSDTGFDVQVRSQSLGALTCLVNWIAIGQA